MTKSWKTTAFGAVAALGTYLSTVTDPSWVHTVGQILIGAGTFLMGAFARDANVSSESQGVK